MEETMKMETFGGNIVKFRLIPGWQDKGLTCTYCGTKKSVKYAVISSGASVPCCNRCVLSVIDDDFYSNLGMEDTKDEDEKKLFRGFESTGRRQIRGSNL